MSSINYIRLYDHNEKLKQVYKSLSDEQLLKFIRSQTALDNKRKSGYINLIQEATGEKIETCRAWMKTNKGKNRMNLGCFILWACFIGIDPNQIIEQMKDSEWIDTLNKFDSIYFKN